MASRTFSQDLFNKMSDIDQYVCENLLAKDADLESALEANRASNLDAIDVAPNQGKMLYLLAKMNNARRILEIGTLGGYSAIWFAKSLPPDGKLITLEIEPEHARIAQSNINNAGLQNKVEIKVGAAIETLEKMGREGHVEKFDMIFIDADKENNVGYLKWALEFSRKGTLIVVDNVVRRGRVIDRDNKDPAVVGVRNLFEMMKNEKRIDSTAIQTVGSKGWDGFALALVLD